MKVFGAVGRVTGNSWLDIGGDPDHAANVGIFERNFYHCGIRQKYTNFVVNSRICRRIRTDYFLKECDVSLAMNRSILLLI